MRNKEIEKIAAEYYSPDMPYHNFQHAITVLEDGRKMMARCRDEGVKLNEEVVYYAILFHDAGYHENEAEIGFDSKEAYSAHLAEKILADHDIDNEIIAMVKSAILSTHCDAQCRSNEDKVVRAADLHGLAKGYEIFKENAVKLKDEFELLTGQSVTWESWKNMVIERVGLFLREELDLTSDYYDDSGQSVFHQRARENLKILESDNAI